MTAAGCHSLIPSPHLTVYGLWRGSGRRRSNENVEPRQIAENLSNRHGIAEQHRRNRTRHAGPKLQPLIARGVLGFHARRSRIGNFGRSPLSRANPCSSLTDCAVSDRPPRVMFQVQRHRQLQPGDVLVRRAPRLAVEGDESCGGNVTEDGRGDS
jgi:hypothetical protein